MTESERLAAIGQTVTFMGHEGRNALQSIKSRVELIRLRASGNVELMEDVYVIESAADRLKCIFEELGEPGAPYPLDRKASLLRELVASVSDSL